MSVRIIITGGTFDKGYDALKGELGFENTHLPEILRQVRWFESVELEINQLKDSLDMDDSDRLRILKSVLSCPENQIIITHGTDTMTRSADYLLRGLPTDNKKTVVLTGAMVPYSFKNSDALFNLGCAAQAVQLLEPGVYITMNGKTFRAGQARKNKDAGLFEGNALGRISSSGPGKE